jgi:hypothetical protein
MIVEIARGAFVTELSLVRHDFLNENGDLA